MSAIFPGMDPYLEDPILWPGVHASLIIYIRDQIQPRLRPRYVAAIEQRVYLQGPDRSVQPDATIRHARRGAGRPEGGRGGGPAVATMEADAPVEVWAPPEPIRESYVNILDLKSGRRIVTVIELVSPSNKYAGPGRESYLAKQAEVLASDAHLVEIDLLRHGPFVMAVPEASARSKGYYDYLTCVNRARGIRARYELYPRRLRDRLPRIRVPLADDDPDVPLDVQATLARTYEEGAYRDWIDYRRPCDPPLSADDQAWADALIGQALGGDAAPPQG